MTPYILTEYRLRLESVTRSEHPTDPRLDTGPVSPTEPCAGEHPRTARATAVVYVHLEPGGLCARMHLCAACLAALPVASRTYTDEDGTRPTTGGEIAPGSPIAP